MNKDRPVMSATKL